MNVLEDMYKLKGCKVSFSTETSSYEGIVKSIMLQTRRITFEKVTLFPKMNYFGMQNFFAHEIKSYSLISKPEEKSNGNSMPRTLLQYSAGAKDLKDNHIHNDLIDDDVISDHDASEVCDEDVEEEFILEIPEKFRSKVPIDNVIIDSFNSDFYDAVRSMKSESIIGMSFEGKAIGRKGCLEWLCISTQCCTFLFDIQTLGPKAFAEGLKEIIENPAIEKIIHDCRQVSDCLFHQYQTSLVNVFDTQVADLFVNAQLATGSKTGMTKRVHTVDNCLARYLEFTSNFVQNQTFKKKYAEKDCVMWASRPLSNLYRSRAINNVLYLKSLKTILVEQMMNPYYRTVELYLKVVKNASEQELELEPSVPQFVPEALLMEGIQSVCFNNFVEVSSTPSAGFSIDNRGRPIDRYLKSIENLSRKQLDTSSIHCSKMDNIEQSYFKVEKKDQKANSVHSSKFQKNSHTVNSDKVAKGISYEKDNQYNKSPRGFVSSQGSNDNAADIELNNKVSCDQSKDDRNASGNISPKGSVSSRGSSEVSTITMDQIQKFIKRMSMDSGTGSSSVSSGRSSENDVSNNEGDSDSILCRKSGDRRSGRNFRGSTSSESGTDGDKSNEQPHYDWPVVEDGELPKNVILVPAGMTAPLSRRRKQRS